MEKLVTVATFDLPAEARTVKMLLEDQGFDVFLDDDQLVGMNWFLSNAVGGAKIQVPQSQAQAATKFVEEVRRNAHEKSEQSDNSNIVFSCEDCDREVSFPGNRSGSVETCPHCGEYIDVP